MRGPCHSRRTRGPTGNPIVRATPDEAALREEVRDWLRANLPWEYGKGLPPRFDDLAEEGVARRGVPQGRHAHAILAAGRRRIEAWFPGITDELVSKGGLVGDGGDHAGR